MENELDIVDVIKDDIVLILLVVMEEGGKRLGRFRTLPSDRLLRA